jgi:glutamyl-Q tRNA(Asp) synthetase
MPRAWRVRTVSEVICFEDRLHRRDCQNVAEVVGDFVVMRGNGEFAYQLAVVVDDHSQEITDVVRGADLLDSTPRQIYLQRLLGFATPRYMHIPVATDSSGNKLTKQNHAPALDRKNAGSLICSALVLLRLAPPEDLSKAPVREIWEWASNAWSHSRPKPGNKLDFEALRNPRFSNS